ncbi:hypothetical protein BJV82DRAFT_582668 [Fennellomyces sp. T-0311]|nr:hypothetical protein BJV82DRAFT_582668 [Fennellomyces sp. T-0311]
MSIPYSVLLFALWATAVQAQVDTTGWNPDENYDKGDEKSWLEQHGRFAFIIVIGLLVLGLLIWYIVRSVKGMRRRLKMENENQMQMMRQIADGREGSTVPRQPDHVHPSTSIKNDQDPTSPVTPITPPPRY